jgi:hypothetical protein
MENVITYGECNNLTRAAVRAAFHACFNGASEGKLAQRFKVGVADMFHFAGGKY